jgi:hypothetical protein
MRERRTLVAGTFEDEPFLDIAPTSARDALPSLQILDWANI